MNHNYPFGQIMAIIEHLIAPMQIDCKKSRREYSLRIHRGKMGINDLSLFTPQGISPVVVNKNLRFSGKVCVVEKCSNLSDRRSVGSRELTSVRINSSFSSLPCGLLE